MSVASPRDGARSETRAPPSISPFAQAVTGDRVLSGANSPCDVETSAARESHRAGEMTSFGVSLRVSSERRWEKETFP